MSGKRETTKSLLAWPALLLFIGAISAALPPSPVSAGGVPKPQPVATRGGPLPSPLPLFPSDNWWNVDISAAPLAPNSAAFISFINNGGNRRLHPDFGGFNTDEPPHAIYGIPYVVVDGTQPKVAVQFDYSDESDGVDHNTDTSFPFYPIPPEAITQGQWIEGGQPGNQNPGGDRHMLIVDKDNNHLYELYDLRREGSSWAAGSGAFFDMNTNDRRPEGWTSADAAGLAILPGLVRFDEVYGPDEINHAFRVTLRAANGHVFPASHTAGTNPSALPMGARLRMKASTNISGFPADMQKIFRAMKKHGLIMADNGSDMYITGAFNAAWDSDVLNDAFHALHANDFEVIQLGYIPPEPQVVSPLASSISMAKATLGGTVSNDGGSPILGRGVVVSVTSVNANPSIGGTGVTQLSTAGTTGAFTLVATGLNPSTAYSFKAYATNAVGTGYTALTSFTTPAPPSRVFISSSGNDANVCSNQLAPCRNISEGIAQVQADGEIIILKPGEYETAPLVIPKGLKITSPSGTVAFVRQPITINAPGGRVVLRGLTLKGNGAGDGITLVAASSLSVEETTFDRWANGLNVGAASGSFVSLSNVAFIANTSGLLVAAGGTNRIAVEGTRFERNGTGLLIHSGALFLRESSLVGNTAAGLSIDGGTADVQRSEVAFNNVGVNTLTGGTVRIARSRVFGNTTGLSAAGGSTLASSGTNVVRRNTTNTTGTITAIPEQ